MPTPTSPPIKNISNVEPTTTVDSPLTGLIEQITQNLNTAHRLLTPQKGQESSHASFARLLDDPVAILSHNYFQHGKKVNTQLFPPPPLPPPPHILSEQVVKLTKTIEMLSNNMQAQAKENQALRQELQAMKSTQKVEEEMSRSRSGPTLRRKSSISTFINAAETIGKQHTFISMFFGVLTLLIFLKTFFTFNEHNTGLH